MMHGVNPAAFFFLPMIGKNYGDFPRFRDCWVQARESAYDGAGTFPYMKEMDVPEPEKATPHVYVYTRVGGGNREDYQTEIDAIRTWEGYVRDYDGDFDCTFATFVFAVPEKWHADYQIMRAGEPHKTSAAYRELVYANLNNPEMIPAEFWQEPQPQQETEAEPA